MKELTSVEQRLEIWRKVGEGEFVGECAALRNSMFKVCKCQVQLSKIKGCVGECEAGSIIQMQSEFVYCCCQTGHLEHEN